MRYNIILLVIAFLGAIFLNNNASSKIIPKEAIRFRVIASSDSEEDQEIKNMVTKKVMDYLDDFQMMDHHKAQTILRESSSTVEALVNSSIKENGFSMTSKVKFGKNFFPKKTYKGYVYESGYYDSLVIELGEANGENFWCVLYPPICMLEKVDEDVEYESFIFNLIDGALDD